MRKKQSRLVGVGPVCCDNVKSKAHSRTPNPSLFANIPLLWEILELIIRDWGREITPLQAIVNGSSSQSEKLSRFLKAFSALQPHYLKSIFSFAVFVIALEGAYDRFYEELNTLNRKSFLRVSHDKKPKSTAYVEKVRMIRDISVAHIGSKKEKATNAAVAMMWQPMTFVESVNESWDLNKMTFGGMKLTLHDSTGKVIDQSDDFEIKGIPEMESLCRQYLDEYDRVCAAYLKAIHAKLPITVGDEQYFEFKAKVPIPWGAG